MTAPGEPLLALARAAGLEPSYTGWRGEGVTASAEALLGVLGALGVSVTAPDDTGAAMAELERARWGERVPPVVVAWDGMALAVPLQVPAEDDAAWELEVVTEGGQRHRAAGRLFDLAAHDHAWPAARGGRVHCVRTARVELGGEHGYHQLAWQVGAERGTAHVLAAPTRCWGAPGEAPRRWGVFAPLYALRDAASGGAGDLRHLRALFERVAARGGQYVATLPLLSAFLDEPCHPSPYAPASRLFWNELYLALEEAGGAAALARPAVAAERARLLARPEVDYRAQYAWRRGVLDELAAAAWAGAPEVRAAVEARARQGALADYAVFRAIGEAERAPWPAWPAALRDGVPFVASLDEVPAGVDLGRVRTHAWAQWQMGEQLGALKRDFGGEGGLYLDLPVGVNRDAYEVWRHRALFLLALSTGAPPDALFVGGQDWGLPPLAPAALRATGYRYLAACLRHHMHRASMLRIDHVMGLHRLYCVPRGFAATEGVYVRYHPDEIYAVVAIESHRHQCAVVGEDLGTVPAEVRPAMRRHGVASLFVGQFAMPGAPGQAMAVPAAEQVASLNTHDTPTFAGYWRGADIDDKLALGLIDGAEAEVERGERAATRAALGADDPGDDACRAAMRACTRALAASPAHVVLVNLEDLWLEPAPQNVPGTSEERPNWRRPWSRPADEALADPAVADALADVAALRPR
ncbi:MAG: 4-alpha-glucanotransferase [Kofleriaceae bacterium]|nr:4-alpha-glucanotransferase [Kofleriaceae bacterium]MCL4225932.1 4-alpha-glucanotransferase [Myxococcales bacterium]